MIVVWLLLVLVIGFFIVSFISYANNRYYFELERDPLYKRVKERLKELDKKGKK